MGREKPSEIIETPESISVKAAGRRGGLATSTRFKGTDFYQKIGARGGNTTKRRWGHLFSEYGKLGGRPRRSSLEDMGEQNQK